jgi:tetratricopeptide (TPR) repeat protein
MQEQVAWSAGKAGVEHLSLSEEADTAAYSGRLVRSREFSRRAVQSAVGAADTDSAASEMARGAWRELEIGDLARAQKAAEQALKLKPTQAVKVLSAIVFAITGDPLRAGKLADELNHEFPLDTFVQTYWLSCIRAATALANNNLEESIHFLQATRANELSTFWGTLPTMQPNYLRGLAYLKANQGQQAATEFQMILNHSGVSVNFVNGALARLQLGRAQAMMGDKIAARKSYQNFLTLWKDADPDIPIYKQAKGEYAKVR